MKQLWARLNRRAPRRLTVSAAGKLLLLLSVTLGVAAINTGHNGLFLAWGLAMGVMVVSGVISEMSLRALMAQVANIGPLRTGSLGRIELSVHNLSMRFGAYALECRVRLVGVGPQAGCLPPQSVALPLVLTLARNTGERLGQSFVPLRRGPLRIDEVEVSTSYPFGFFAKARRLPVTPQLVWVWPARLTQPQAATQLLAQMGELLSPEAGAGDEFFALRPWRPGEDLRRLIWRRLARTGRPFVVETAAHQARQLVLVARVDAQAPYDVQERAIAAIGTLAEDLLLEGYGVGLRCNGVAIAARAGGGPPRAQIARVLDALAQLDVDRPLAQSVERARDALPELGLRGAGLLEPPASHTTLALTTEGAA